METLVPEDSPLAAYLEGNGEADLGSEFAPTRPSSLSDTQGFPDLPLSYAPRGNPTIRARLNRRTRSLLATGPVTRIRDAYAYAIASTLGAADNERFLEHFRYILIASQLLNDHVAPAAFKQQPGPNPSGASYGPLNVTVEGVGISAFVAFALVFLLHWARGAGTGTFHPARLLLVLVATTLTGLVIYGYARRKWLQVLRHQAVGAASDLVSTAQSFEASSTSTLAMIQEVELVSRGYRISSPLPPISRLEGNSQPRRCPRLRRNLHSVFTVVLPAFIDAAKVLCHHASDDDLERFLEAYDVRGEDLVEAFQGCPEIEDVESLTLRQARVVQARLLTLRRLVICSLLSVPATGRKEDAVRWSVCVQEMKKLSDVLGSVSERTVELLHNEENVCKPGVQPSKEHSPDSAKTLPQSQARRISALSSGIRSIQARLYLFQDDSTRALSNSDTTGDLLTISTSLKSQYEAIGADLRALMQAWESGRQALVDDITKQERRVSLVSTGPRTSLRSMGGLTAVGESDDEASVTMSPRSSAFKKLTGDRPLSPPTTESEDEGSKDGEVFEAVALPPRQRSTLTREQRIAKMYEERERLAHMREKREANSNMIRELQTVINLRPQNVRRRNTLTGPTTSV